MSSPQIEEFKLILSEREDRNALLYRWVQHGVISLVEFTELLEFFVQLTIDSIIKKK